jgi:hypothetical protein
MRALLVTLLASVLTWTALADVAHVGTLSEEVAAGTTLTITNGCSNSGGAQGMVWVGVNWNASSSQTISSITCQGNAMTQVGSNVDPGTGRLLAKYRYMAPGTTGNVVVTFSASVPYGQAAATTLSGVDQTTPVGDVDSTTAISGGPTSTPAVTCSVGDLAIDQLLIQGNGTSIAVAGDQTLRASEDGDGLTLSRWSTEDGAATNTMGYTWTGGAAFGHIVSCIQDHDATSALLLRRRRS